MANEVVARFLVRPFFFVLPADARSNNARVLVNRVAVEQMKQPPAG